MALTHYSGIDSYMASALNYLPATYDATLYGEFIQFWGTHYITQSSVGGVAQLLVYMGTCVLTNIASPLPIEQGMGFDLRNGFGPGSVPSINYNQIYLNSRKVSTIDIVGGNPELADIHTQWAQRVASFQDNPVHLYFTYQPIYNLITDPAKKANMQAAVQAYIAKFQSASAQFKSVLDARVISAFMEAQWVYSIVQWTEFQNDVTPKDPYCIGYGHNVTDSGKRICYFPAKVTVFQHLSVTPGQTSWGTYCFRDKATGLMSSSEGACTKPVPAGCVWCNPGDGYSSEGCCMGVAASVINIPGKYGFTGQTTTIACPP